MRPMRHGSRHRSTLGDVTAPRSAPGRSRPATRLPPARSRCRARPPATAPARERRPASGPGADRRPRSRPGTPGGRSAARSPLALLLFVTVVLVLFVVFNTQTVDISLVFADVEAPLVLALLIARCWAASSPRWLGAGR